MLCNVSDTFLALSVLYQKVSGKKAGAIDVEYREIKDQKIFIRQWRDKAKKMTEEAAKRRIAKWLEERYRIANARKNWIDLATKYDLFMNNRLLYEIRRRLAQFAKARDMVDRLRFRFLKTGKDQFTDGIKFISFLRFLKQLVENWDERNRLLTLRHYLKKWADKARKLKEKEA